MGGLSCSIWYISAEISSVSKNRIPVRKIAVLTASLLCPPSPPSIYPLTFSSSLPSSNITANMPCLRGIELSIIIQPDSLPLPEFPHPDASSVRVVSLGEIAQAEEFYNESSPHGSDSTHIQKLAPRASVYIPSTPGSQFWVQYRIRRSPEPSCYLYLKLFMNGRHITSCGITDAASGTISRALYEPSDRWHLKQNGTLLKRSGIESRSFCFSPGPDAAAAADDGGLIEVQVFRAKSRRRCTPQLVPHRDQQQYGVMYVNPWIQ